MKCGLIIDPKDNVVVVTEAVSFGEYVSYRLDGKEYGITAKEDIPVYHKIARQAIAEGTPVVKYGQIIGVAVTAIDAGAYVHCHNVKSMSKEVL